MIVLDTHIWVWWAHANEQLTESQERIIQANQIIVATARFYSSGLGGQAETCSPAALGWVLLGS